MFKGAMWFFVAVLGAACLAGAVGCGGSGSQELTKAEFSQQAGTICEESEKRRGEIIAQIGESTNPNGNVQARQEEVIEKALPTYEEAAQQIDELGAPKGEEKKVKALVAAMEEAADKATADPHTAMISNMFFRKADQLLENWKLSGCVI